MSYDLEIGVVIQLSSRPESPTRDKWLFTDQGATRGGRTWQIVITGPLRVELEDVPEEVVQSLPGISHVFQVSLEPMGAPKSACALLCRTARSLASASDGVIADQQTGQLELPSGVRRYRPESAGSDLALIKMTWFFTESPLLEPGGVSRLTLRTKGRLTT